ncbi:hypothetical protein [Nocardiopsis kunsanensis]|uniref:Uncharacterized protein n=1 Tax=Nocardiopsis kunsanensis TaxID=141693 RepID=A0A919CID9_9ACTN|nr:hypothetical protein [Nocardiopsis kunsanensis]GHD26914.1 hypothetical protein GCM10007147_25510 [Nocardiopsis kunsanensis]
MAELNPVDLQKALKGASTPRAVGPDLTGAGERCGQHPGGGDLGRGTGPVRGPDDVQEALFGND